MRMAGLPSCLAAMLSSPRPRVQVGRSTLNKGDMLTSQILVSIKVSDQSSLQKTTLPAAYSLK